MSTGSDKGHRHRGKRGLRNSEPWRSWPKERKSENRGRSPTTARSRPAQAQALLWQLTTAVENLMPRRPPRWAADQVYLPASFTLSFWSWLLLGFGLEGLGCPPAPALFLIFLPGYSASFFPGSCQVLPGSLPSTLRGMEACLQMKPGKPWDPSHL